MLDCLVAHHQTLVMVKGSLLEQLDMEAMTLCRGFTGLKKVSVIFQSHGKLPEGM